MSSAIRSLRAVLALALLAGFYALAAAFVLLDLLLVLGPVLWAPDGEQRFVNGSRSFVLALGSVPVLLALGRAVAAVSRPAPVPEGAVRVPPSEVPRLWETVREVAHEMGLRPPDALHLTAEADAAVREHGPMLGLRPGRRHVYVGLPLLMCLTRDQLRAVLAHEFGHLGRGRTRFGAVVHRCAVALGTGAGRPRHSSSARDGLPFPMGGPVGGPMGGVLRVLARAFDRLTFPLRRRQELEADEAAAALAGRAVAAAALRSRADIAVAWRRFSEVWLRPSAAEGIRPDDPFRAFRWLMDRLPGRPVARGPAATGP
ncbi:M48 family metallopeptidase, partial [Streptomyces sp. URMC 123]|uniref:M48 family metallopeptidase n=1 Tax=Streptomyces sp. URMC 123 TaxID=3423403 RepID=UPI003F19EB92